MKHCKAAAEHFQASNTHDPSRLESDKAGAVRLVQVLHHLQLQGDFLELFEAGTQTVVLASLFVQSQGQSTTRMGFLQCFRFHVALGLAWHECCRDSQDIFLHKSEIGHEPDLYKLRRRLDARYRALPSQVPLSKHADQVGI